jgi:ABC-type multidrug transport system ATPase subunit
MRRRLDLASSLLTRPRVLFLDEPTTGLDPRSRNEIWSVVRELEHCRPSLNHRDQAMTTHLPRTETRRRSDHNHRKELAS